MALIFKKEPGDIFGPVLRANGADGARYSICHIRLPKRQQWHLTLHCKVPGFEATQRIPLITHTLADAYIIARKQDQQPDTDIVNWAVANNHALLPTGYGTRTVTILDADVVADLQQVVVSATVFETLQPGDMRCRRTGPYIVYAFWYGAWCKAWGVWTGIYDRMEQLHRLNLEKYGPVQHYRGLVVPRQTGAVTGADNVSHA